MVPQRMPSPLPLLVPLVPLVLLVTGAAGCSYFSSYSGAALSAEQLATYEAAADTKLYCVNKIRACNATEGRRTDGSCNNLQNPTAGSGHAPYLRLSMPHFVTNQSMYEVRRAVDGSALPNPRKLRTQVLPEGRVPSEVFTQLMSHLLIFAVTDIAGMSIHDTLNYELDHTTCCSAAASEDPMCAGISVDEEDPVHRFSGVRCLNMTWPISFQNTGCKENNTAPERMYYGTPFFDLSVMYGNDETTPLRQRNGTGGLLNYELTTSGYQWPVVNTTIPTNITYDGIDSMTGTNYIFGLFHWREHNRLAAELAEINPCWSDDQLFDAARDINIATYAQILYYELLAPLMGEQSLQRLGVLAPDAGFHDVYDAEVYPAMIIDSLTSLRWIHTTIDVTLYFYTANGTKTAEYLVQELALNRAALNTAQANIQYIAQGSFRQPCANIDDHIIDPVLAEWVLGTTQFSADVASDDVAKARMLGLSPYVDYVQYCDDVSITSFDDLYEYMDEDRILVLKEMYTDVRDIDMPTGLWSERLLPDAHVPPTFRCLVSRLLVRSVVSDRHWYERAERPNAFTAAQLAEIRRASVARMMCDNADSVVEITPKAFRVISEDNKLTDCSDIPKIDLTAWQDSSCSSS